MVLTSADNDLEDLILASVTEALCKDLDLKPDDFQVHVLVLVWNCNANQTCRYTRHQFPLGCITPKADSVRKKRGRGAQGGRFQLPFTQRPEGQVIIRLYLGIFLV